MKEYFGNIYSALATIFIGMKITFPYTVKKEDVDKLIKSEPPQNQSVLASMYI